MSIIETIFSNSETVQRQQTGTNLNLKLVGETSNANDLISIHHIANATSQNQDAISVGLIDTHLITRSLEKINLQITADATNGSDWAYGLKNVEIEADKNKIPLIVNIDVEGSTKASADGTLPSVSSLRLRRPDPSFGFENSTLTSTKFDDDITIRVKGRAGPWTNQAVVYGLNVGNNRLDGINLKSLGASVLSGRIRPSLQTGKGDDNVLIEVIALNSGSDYSNPIHPSAIKGKQRSAALNRTFVDLGEGDDKLQLNSQVELSDGILSSQTIQGAGSINGLSFFDGGSFATKTKLAAASLDLHESGVSAGAGNDELEFFNGWSSDIWLDDGNDVVKLTAGNDLYIHAGDGNDRIEFIDSNANYIGIKNTHHVVETSEGSVFIDKDVETINIDGKDVYSSSQHKKNAESFDYVQPLSKDLPEYRPTGNWELDKFATYVDMYPMTLLSGFQTAVDAGRATNKALWGMSHYNTSGKAVGRVLPDPGNSNLDIKDYGAYVENYGTTLLDIYRASPESNQSSSTFKSLFNWGKDHYKNNGKAAGREIDGGVDWGAIVKNNYGLYNDWQDSLLSSPTKTAFRFGYENQNRIKNTHDVIVGSDGRDKLTGQVVYGLNGEDVLRGTDGDDLLAGGFGSDLIVGTGGTDVVYGGPDRDVFQLNKGGAMNIRDFRQGADLIQLGADLDPNEVTLKFGGVDNCTKFYVGNELIGEVYGQNPNDFTFATQSASIDNVFI